MKSLHVHNYYQARGGEDRMVDLTLSSLRAEGYATHLYKADSKTILNLKHKVQAFDSGFFSASSYRDLCKILRQDSFDIMHLYNVFPLISPSVLVAAKRYGVPVVMTCPNFRLSCPIGTKLRDEANCELCSAGNPMHCVRHNCRGRYGESIGYALRHLTSDMLYRVKTSVDLFLPPSEHVASALAQSGVDRRKISVLPNATDLEPCGSDDDRSYVGFAGRITQYKGLETLFAAASSSGLPVKIAGGIAPDSKLVQQAPPNVSFLGQLDRQSLQAFYRKAKIIVVPSMWRDPYPLVALEAMSQGAVVVASRIGGLPEMVQDDVTGKLFEPGDSAELAAILQRLWRDAELCSAIRQRALAWIDANNSPGVYQDRLIRAYRLADTLHGQAKRSTLQSRRSLAHAP